MICETGRDECVVCLLVDRGVRSEGGIYFAGLLHGMRERCLALSFCPLHFAAWSTVVERWKLEVASLPGVQ